jgi:hypothetical protein
LWGFLGLGKEQKEFCIRKLCEKPLGKLLNNSLSPISALSGGLISPFCPITPTLADLADPGAVGAASKVMLDEAGAAKRRAAVRYLGTVDCHYWPEAEEALIGALRGDRNECVRYEAALALANGCCCTKKTIEALNIVVSCSDRDNAPKETSHRVQSAARMALDRCMACYQVAPPAPPPKPIPEGEALPEPKTPPAQPDTNASAAKREEPRTLQPFELGEAKPFPPKSGVVQAAATTMRPNRPSGFEYYRRIALVPWEPLIAEARRTLDMPLRNPPPPEQSLVGLMTAATESVPMPGDGARAELLSERPATLWDVLVSKSGGVVTEESKVVVVSGGPALPALKSGPTRESIVVASSTMPIKAPAKVIMGVSASKPPQEPAVAKAWELDTPPMAATSSPYNAMGAQAAPAPKAPAKVIPPAPGKATENQPAKPAPTASKPTTLAVAAAQPQKPMPPLESSTRPVGGLLNRLNNRTNEVPQSSTTVSLPMPTIVKPAPSIKIDDPTLMVPAPAAPKPITPKKFEFTSPPAAAAPKSSTPIKLDQSTMPVPAPVASRSIEPKKFEFSSPPATPAVPQPLPIADTTQVPSPAIVVPPPVVIEVKPTGQAQKTLAALSGAPEEWRSEVEELEANDVKSAPEIVGKLLNGTRNSVSVEDRKSCLRALVRCRAATPEVFATLQQLSEDKNPALRSEAVIGLARLRMAAPDVAAQIPSKPMAVTKPAVHEEAVSATQSTSLAREAMEAFGNADAHADRMRCIEALNVADVQSSPELIGKLIDGARGAGTVEGRKACIRALVRSRVATPEVFAILEQLSEDKAAAIRAEAVIGMARLKMASAGK